MFSTDSNPENFFSFTFDENKAQRGQMLRACWRKDSSSGLSLSLGSQTFYSILHTLPTGRSFRCPSLWLSVVEAEARTNKSWAGKITFSFRLPRIFQSPEEMETLGTSLFLAPSSQPHFSLRAPDGPEGGSGPRPLSASGACRGQSLMWVGKDAVLGSQRCRFQRAPPTTGCDLGQVSSLL